MTPESIRARALRVGAAWVVVAAVRLALVLLPLRHVQRLVETLAGRRAWLRAEAPSYTGHRVARVARAVPGATCLTQALSARVLLAWHGHPGSAVRLGVRRDGADLVAHAWLEYRGQVLIGGPDVSAYRPLDPPRAWHAR